MLTKFELFNYNSYNIGINVEVEDKDEFKCLFKIGNDEYFFHARDENKIQPETIRYGWHLSFGIVGPNKYNLTGKNIPFKVLSSVNKCFEMFVEKYNPDKMSFIAEGDKKAQIYLNLFKGYDISKRESGLDSLSDYTPYLFMINKK
jgi:hypothetical protein